MMNVLKSVGLAATLTLAPLAASAATLSFTGTGQMMTLPSIANYFPGDTVDVITGDLKSTSNGLFLNDGPARVTYTFNPNGFRAQNDNFTASVGTEVFRNGSTPNGTTYSYIETSNGLLDFAFGTDAPAASIGLFSNAGVAAPASNGYAVAYVKVSDTSYYALFDDIALPNRDFDDMAILIEIASVPLPAGGLLLLSGLGAAAAMRRRKKAS